MAETTRTALAEADAVIARIRARLGESPTPIDGEAANAARIADEWTRRVEQLHQTGVLATAARDFRQRWPALVRWREQVLANQKRMKPAIVAAAFESLALECTLAGQSDLAARALEAAIDVMRSRGMRSVVPIRSAANGNPADADAPAQSA